MEGVEETWRALKQLDQWTVQSHVAAAMSVHAATTPRKKPTLHITPPSPSNNHFCWVDAAWADLDRADSKLIGIHKRQAAHRKSGFVVIETSGGRRGDKLDA